MPMESILQTNRTILFEEINPEKLDLLTLIGDVKGFDSLDEDKMKEINDNLLVKNFDEFLTKFEPKVYSFFNAATQKVVYTLKKPEGIGADAITEINLDENNDFLKMLFTLIDTKKSQGLKNVDFKFQNVLDMISPKKVMEDIKQVRKEINYLYNKYEEMEDEDPTRLEIGDKLNVKFEEASQNYNNVLAMLPLAIEDIKTRLLLGKSEDGEENEKVSIGLLSMGEDGELKIIEAPKGEGTDVALVNEGNNNSLIECFQDDYDAVNETPNEYVANLVVRTFCPLPSIQNEIDTEKEVGNYNTYLEFYKNSKDDFVKAAKPLIEKLLGVKMYFEQYDTKSKGMLPKLLICNTKLDMMVKSANKPRLETYLNTTNAKNDFDETIWFGIVPSIELEASASGKKVRERFQGTNKTKKPKAGNTLESLTALLDLVRLYKIQVFFNFEATDETTFNNMATVGVDKYLDKTEALTKQSYSEYAIPCLPNFTVIPKNRSDVVLDSKMISSESGASLSSAKEDIIKLWLEGVYVDASYVAAGLTAAYQCPEFLKQHFRKVNSNFPGVRFDLEGGDNSLRVTTTLAKEIAGFTNTVKADINRKNFGFLFSSENGVIDGKSVKRITVYKARNLAETDDGFEGIYKTLVATYVERMLRFQTSDFKQNKIVSFFSSNPKSQKSQWSSNQGFTNSVLQQGDDFTHEIDAESSTCNLNLSFNGTVKNLEVNITKSSNN